MIRSRMITGLTLVACSLPALFGAVAAPTAVTVTSAASATALPHGARCSATGAASAVVGACAPAFTLSDVQGRRVALTHYRGHPVLLNFWGVGCTYCAQELPDLKRFAATFTRRGGVILGVNTWGEPRDLIAGYAHSKGVTWPLLPDQPGTIGALYGVRGTPTNVFVNRVGVITAITVGPIAFAQFQKNVQRL